MRRILRGERIVRGLSQKDVANHLGISERSYSFLECGTRKGSIETWDALEDMFEIPQRQLRSNTKEPDGNPAE